MQQVLPRVVFANSFGVSYFCFASFVVRFDHPPPPFLVLSAYSIRHSVRLLAVVQLLPL